MLFSRSSFEVVNLLESRAESFQVLLDDERRKSRCHGPIAFSQCLLFKAEWLIDA